MPSSGKIGSAILPRTLGAHDERFEIFGIAASEGVLQSAAKRYGAKWDRVEKVWVMSRAVARELRLTDRIVEWVGRGIDTVGN